MGTRERIDLAHIARVLACVAVLGAFAESEVEAEPVAKGAATEDRRARVDSAVAEILASPLRDSDYREQERCVHTRAIRRVEILDDRRILVFGRGETAWINHWELNSSCGGRPFNRFTLATEQRSARMCHGDWVYFVERDLLATASLPSMSRLGVNDPLAPIGPRCRLGRFDRISRDQANFILASWQPSR